MVKVYNETSRTMEELRPGQKPTAQQLSEMSDGERFELRRLAEDEDYRIAAEARQRAKERAKAVHAASHVEIGERLRKAKEKREAEAERIKIAIAETDQSRIVGTQRAEELKTWARLRKEGRTL